MARSCEPTCTARSETGPTRPYPVLVTRLPYDKNVIGSGQLDFKALVRAGYIVVAQDTRGRYSSDGEWLPWKYEREDGYDTVEWAASLPGSNDKVGMFGVSYFGSTQWSAAIAGAPHLVAITPITTWADPDNGLMFGGGALELGLNGFWGLMTALSQIPKAGLNPDDMIKRLMTTVSDYDTLATQTYWRLPAGAQPMLESTGQPDLGVTRALADPATLDESRVSNRYDEIKVPASDSPAGTTSSCRATSTTSSASAPAAAPRA